MASITDTLGLSRLVGSSTFLRGYSYAQQGRVSGVQWLEGPERLYGHIRGTRSEPYSALVTLTEDWDGAITSLQGHCTCPVGEYCKHVVALVLVAYDEVPEQIVRSVPAAVARRADPAASAKTPTPAPWERSFTALLGTTTAEVASHWAPLALQFELMDGKTAAQRTAQIAQDSRAHSPAMRLGVRPVVLSDKGKWVRTGISWSALGYGSYHYGRTYNPEHLRLLSELASLGSSGGGYYYRQEPWIYLDALGSRRIWNLLDDGRACGLPLVRADKDQSFVTLSEQPASIALDITRTGSELVVTPLVDLGHPPEAGAGLAHQALSGVRDAASGVRDTAAGLRHQLLGSPPHGVVLWPANLSPTVNPKDYPWSVARLDRPVHPEMVAFLGGGQSPGVLRIPTQDEPRFLRDYYPRLRQRVALVSRDGSFEFPEDDEPTLVLTVTRLPEHQVDLRWEWEYGTEDARRPEPLWPDNVDAPYGIDGLWGPPETHRDLVFERKVIESLELDPDDFGPLMQDTLMGRRLAPALRLNGLGTVEFLTQTLPRLMELDHLTIRVEGSGAVYRPADEEPVVAISSTQSADDRDWFDLAITVSVDSEDVPFQDIFTALAQDHSHLILPSGTYFPLDGHVFQELKTLIEEARALQDAPDKGLRINRYQTSLWDELQELGVVSAQASAWKDAVAALQDHDLITAQPSPSTLKATLRPYQQVGFNWLTFLFEHRLGGVLADDMGLGKTIQTLALICHVHETRDRHADNGGHGGSGDGGRSPFLVVAPTSVVTNWVSECRRFAPDLNVVAVHETQARRGVELAEMHGEADIVVTSYALFRLEFEDYEALAWTGLILDEAQVVKNHQAKTHQCARRLPTEFKLAVTGTPMENNLMELWSMFSITAPGLFPYPTRFVEYYQRPIERSQDGDRLAQLRRRISPFMLRRTKEQVVTDLPPKQEQVIELDLHPKHKRVYETHLQRERQKVLGMIHDLDKNRFAIFRSLMLLRQISLDASLVDPKYDHVPSTKLDALMLQLEDITAEGHRVLVFSQFTGFLGRARSRLDAEKIRYCYLDGSTRNRGNVIEEFRSGDAPVFLISLKAGGVGLNLTEADYCIILDPWWNPATEAQAVDRTHRIGQTKKVTVYRLVAKDTIEEKVMALKATKAKLFDAVLADNGAGGQRALSAADIRELLD